MDRRSFLKRLAAFGGGAALVATEPRLLANGTELYVPTRELLKPDPAELIVATKVDQTEFVRKSYVEMYMTRLDVQYNPVEVTGWGDTFRQYAPAGTWDVNVEATLAHLEEVDLQLLSQAFGSRRPVRWYLMEEV